MTIEAQTWQHENLPQPPEIRFGRIDVISASRGCSLIHFQEPTRYTSATPTPYQAPSSNLFTSAIDRSSNPQQHIDPNALPSPYHPEIHSECNRNIWSLIKASQHHNVLPFIPWLGFRETEADHPALVHCQPFHTRAIACLVSGRVWRRRRVNCP
jgi:hypothetical protein